MRTFISGRGLRPSTASSPERVQEPMQAMYEKFVDLTAVISSFPRTSCGPQRCGTQPNSGASGRIWPGVPW